MFWISTTELRCDWNWPSGNSHFPRMMYPEIRQNISQPWALQGIAVSNELGTHEETWIMCNCPRHRRYHPQLEPSRYGNIHDGNTRPRKCYPSTCSKWDKNQLMERESLTRLPTCAPGCGYHLNNTAFQWNRLIDWEPCHLWEVLYGDAVVQQNCCLYRRATEPCSKAIFWKYHLVLKV